MQESQGRLAGRLPPWEVLGVWPRGDFRVATKAVDGAAIAIVFSLLCRGGRRGLVAAPPPARGPGRAGGRARDLPRRPRHLRHPRRGEGADRRRAAGDAVHRPRPARGRSPAGPRRALALGHHPADRARGPLRRRSRSSRASSPCARPRSARSAHVDELAELRARVAGKEVAFLSLDRFAPYRLRGAERVQSPGGYVPNALRARENKEWEQSEAIDFDTLETDVLDRFGYAVTTGAAYGSSAPENWNAGRAHRQLRALEAKRQGASRARCSPRSQRRETAESGSSPCEITPRAAAGEDGHGRVLARPTRSSPTTTPGGRPGVRRRRERAGSSCSCPTGSWQLSLQYNSEVPLTLRASEGVQAERTLPAALDGFYANAPGKGPFWPAGERRQRRRHRRVRGDRRRSAGASAASSAPSVAPGSAISRRSASPRDPRAPWTRRRSTRRVPWARPRSPRPADATSTGTSWSDERARTPGFRRRHRSQRHARGREPARPPLALLLDPDRVPLPRQPAGLPRPARGPGDQGAVPAQAAPLLVVPDPRRRAVAGGAAAASARAPDPRPAQDRPAGAASTPRRPRLRRRPTTRTRNAACRELFRELLMPLAEEAGKPGLVEMSCFTVAQAPTLVRLFDEAKLVHIVRDGRDAGSSKVAKRQKREHPRDARQGVEWWRGRLAEAEAGARAVPADRLLTISLDELVGGDREASYARLLEFLELADEPAMREFFDSEMTAENAHRDRWRKGLSEPEQADEVASAYEAALDRARGRGLPLGAAAAEASMSASTRGSASSTPATGLRRRHRPQRHPPGREADRPPRRVRTTSRSSAASTPTAAASPTCSTGRITQGAVPAPPARLLVAPLSRRRPTARHLALAPARPRGPRAPQVRPARALRGGRPSASPRPSTPSRRPPAASSSMDAARDRSRRRPASPAWSR